MKVKSVSAGFEPWEVLFDVVCNFPHYLFFHIGEMVSVKRKFGDKVQAIVDRMNNKSTEVKIQYRYHGGELLTRCDEILLPRKCVGAAFGKMPEDKMAQMFPILLELQLQFIANLERVEGQYYSINLESPESSWSQVCELLIKYGHLPVNVELKENTQLSATAMKQLANVCKKTGIRIYIDDLCTMYHRIPENQEYILMLIEILHEHIKIVKIDYDVMRRIRRDWTACKLVGDNLKAFAWFWISATANRPLPFVVFESMPLEALYMINRLEGLAVGYAGCGYQRG